MSTHRTRVQLNLSALLVRGALTVIAGCAAFWVFTTWPSHFGTWAIGGVLGLVALGLGLWTWLSSAEAKCPGCGLAIRGLAGGDTLPVLCRSCVQFVEGEASELWLVEPDRVTAWPHFPAPCPDECVWPKVCAVCGAAATRTVTASWEEEKEATVGRELATAALSLGMLKAVTRIVHAVEVPHCAEHDDGAALRSSFGGGGSDVIFRSHAYHRAFCAANKVTAVPK